MFRTLPRNAFQVSTPSFRFLRLLGLTACATEDGISVDVALSYLVPPLLPFCRPDLFSAALTTNNGTVDIELRQ
jgi:hypothetical protein